VFSWFVEFVSSNAIAAVVSFGLRPIFRCAHRSAFARKAVVMKIKLIIRAFALAAVLALSACESDEPATVSTTTTEETTSVHPVQGPTTTTTTVEHR